MSAVDVARYSAAIIGSITAAGLIWRQVMVVVRFTRRFREWMDHIEGVMIVVDRELKPNAGSTLIDKVRATSVAQELATIERHEIRTQLGLVQADVAKLLEREAA